MNVFLFEFFNLVLVLVPDQGLVGLEDWWGKSLELEVILTLDGMHGEQFYRQCVLARPGKARRNADAYESGPEFTRR